MKRTTTSHHGRDVEWVDGPAGIGAMVDGLRVSIQKMHPTTYQPSRGGALAKPDAPRYRVLVDGVFVQPHWGFRRTLREAKDDGVATAMQAVAEITAARAAFRAKTAAT